MKELVNYIYIVTFFFMGYLFRGFTERPFWFAIGWILSFSIMFWAFEIFILLWGKRK